MHAPVARSMRQSRASLVGELDDFHWLAPALHGNA
jgi:hypothetical protein